MGKKKSPARIYPEGVQTEEGVISFFGPELAGPIESALVLAAGGFNGSAAARLIEFLRSVVIHPVLMLTKVSEFFGHARPLLRGAAGESLFHNRNHVPCAASQQVFVHSPHPSLGCRGVAMRLASRLPQVFLDMEIVDALGCVFEAVSRDAPDP